MNISRERLYELISSAYESGWRGCLDLKSEYVEQVMDQFEHEFDYGSNFGTSQLTLNASPQSISVFGDGLSFNSSYYPNTIPGFLGDTIFVNEPGEEAL